MLIDTEELARRLGITKYGLRVWRREGKGPPFIKLSERVVRYEEADVEAWIAEQKAKGAK